MTTKTLSYELREGENLVYTFIRKYRCLTTAQIKKLVDIYFEDSSVYISILNSLTNKRFIHPSPDKTMYSSIPPFRKSTEGYVVPSLIDSLWVLLQALPTLEDRNAHYELRTPMGLLFVNGDTEYQIGSFNHGNLEDFRHVRRQDNQERVTYFLIVKNPEVGAELFKRINIMKEYDEKMTVIVTYMKGLSHGGSEPEIIFFTGEKQFHDYFSKERTPR